jgi:hypothetical protein
VHLLLSSHLHLPFGVHPCFDSRPQWNLADMLWSLRRDRFNFHEKKPRRRDATILEVTLLQIYLSSTPIVSCNLWVSPVVSLSSTRSPSGMVLPLNVCHRHPCWCQVWPTRNLLNVVSVGQ